VLLSARVLNNSTIAAEMRHMGASQGRFRARDLGGNYAEMEKALGGYAERIERPEEVAPALHLRRPRGAAGVHYFRGDRVLTEERLMGF
jgi:thiamine pyrophosphate-dependent acetolactate synthase large subunit-like protein